MMINKNTEIPPSLNICVLYSFFIITSSYECNYERYVWFYNTFVKLTHNCETKFQLIYCLLNLSKPFMELRSLLVS